MCIRTYVQLTLPKYQSYIWRASCPSLANNTGIIIVSTYVHVDLATSIVFTEKLASTIYNYSSNFNFYCLLEQVSL